MELMVTIVPPVGLDRIEGRKVWMVLKWAVMFVERVDARVVGVMVVMGDGVTGNAAQLMRIVGVPSWMEERVS